MTADTIAATYDVSIVVRRWAATVIDLIVLALGLLLPDLILGNALYQRTIVIWLGIDLAYYPLLEGLTGFTLGKFLLRIRVVDRDGRRPGLGKASIRTLLRLVEVNPILAGGIPAGIIVLTSKHRQRLGDMLAGTYVLTVRDAARVTPSGVEGGACRQCGAAAPAGARFCGMCGAKVGE